MEPLLSRYIWTNTKRQQVWILLVVALSMVPYYLAFDLPKQIVNGPIQGDGFDGTGTTQVFGDITLPIFGGIQIFPGIPLERVPMLVALSMTFLGLVIVNGLFKFYINTYKGRLGERLLRRIRFGLVDRILRFPPSRFKSIKPGEISSMVKDEVEPLGGFTGDAFVQPALLGGQALTALLFIVVQNVWLGTLTFAVVAIQLAVIPRMRRRLIVLGRERQLTARQLAGRVSDIVGGIDTIHSHDTTNFERADIVARLSRIFRIRYDIYRWKFLVKFLNNFLAQLTPFLFYAVGGYLTITGSLDLGQLVAVIGAYKELPGPLKELIDWDLTRQDVQVKYEQVREQFESLGLIDPLLHAPDPRPDAPLGKPLSVRRLSLVDDGGAQVLDQVTLKFEMAEKVALLDANGSASGALAETLGRIVWPTSGTIMAGDVDLQHLPEALVGRRISYVGPEAYFFAGTLQDNLLYGMKNAPQSPALYTGQEAIDRAWETVEAGLSGNPAFDLNDLWINEESILEHTGEHDMFGAVMSILRLVHLSDDVLDLALHTHLDDRQRETVADSIVALREEVRAELTGRGKGGMVAHFEEGSYNSGATVGENLLFGQLLASGDALRQIVRSDYFRAIMSSDTLGERMFEMGRTIAGITVDLFRDMPADDPFFDRMTLMQPEEIPDYTALLKRLEGRDFGGAATADRIAMMRLSFFYNERWFRFGILDDDLMAQIVRTREKFFDDLPEGLSELIEVYTEGRYLQSATLMENMLFGKVDHGRGNADLMVRAIVGEVLARHGDLCREVLMIGLQYDLGPGGRRLQAVQRQKLNVARTLIRSSDFYVFNQPLKGVDERTLHLIHQDSTRFLSNREQAPGIIAVVADDTVLTDFDRVVRFENGRVLRDGNSETDAHINDSL